MHKCEQCSEALLADRSFRANRKSEARKYRLKQDLPDRKEIEEAKVEFISPLKIKEVKRKTFWTLASK